MMWRINYPNPIGDRSSLRHARVISMCGYFHPPHVYGSA